MIRLEYQIAIAVVLDLLLGDPRWLPHPVKAMGRLAIWLERPARTVFRRPRPAGTITALCVIGASGFAAWGLFRVAGVLHPIAADVVSIALLYTCIAARDLARHSTAVFRALAGDDLPLARRRVGMIVARDTDRLDESGVTRATIESVAENLVDGVTAPLLFAAIAGPVGAIVYKAINTLDATFGYKNDRYREFGWASARIDDAANFVPARLTAPLVALAALVLRQRPGGALRVAARDCRNHASPNAGFAEAAFAGALGVQLGGPSYYFGNPEPVAKPTIGDPHVRLDRNHIRQANVLMYVTTGLFVAFCLAARSLGGHFWTHFWTQVGGIS